MFLFSTWHKVNKVHCIICFSSPLCIKLCTYQHIHHRQFHTRRHLWHSSHSTHGLDLFATFSCCPRMPSSCQSQGWFLYECRLHPWQPAQKLIDWWLIDGWMDGWTDGDGWMRFKTLRSRLNIRHFADTIFKIVFEYERYPLKFHTKYLTLTLKDAIFII